MPRILETQLPVLTDVKLKKLSDIIDTLQVGDRVLTNGDGWEPYERYFTAVVKAIEDVNDQEMGKGKAIFTERDDKIRGIKFDGQWWFGIPTTAISDIPIMALKLPEGIEQQMVYEPQMLVSFFDGEMENYAIISAVLSPKKIQVLLLSEDPSMRRASHYKLNDAEITSLRVYGKLTSYICGDCGKPASNMIHGDWKCTSHTPPSVGEAVLCHDCGFPIPGNQHQRWNSNGRVYDLDSACYVERSNGSNERGAILSYGYKPKPGFIYEVTPDIRRNTPLYLGLENEVEVLNDADANEKATQLKKQWGKVKSTGNRWFYLKHDGTIHNGMEIVSEPATLMAHRKILPWNKMLSWMREHGFESDTFSNTGLHIHANKSFMTQESSIKLGYFINSHKEQSEAVARRSNNGNSKFRSPVMGAEVIKNGDRYMALNWHNTKTVEFRLFKGTVHYRYLREAMEYVDASIRFTKLDKVNATLLKAHKDAWSAFEDFVEENKEAYPYLASLLADLYNSSRLPASGRHVVENEEEDEI